VAASVCSPSRAALLTGCYAPRVGISRVLFPRDEIGLNPDETTIADILREQGYAAACVGKWHLGHHPEFLPTRHGFDSYFGIPYSNDMDGSTDEDGVRHFNVPLMRDEEIVERPGVQATLTRRYTDEAVRFIRASGDKPFFLYLPHTMPHIPLHASEEFDGRSERGAYGDVIEEIDASVGRIMDTLAELALDDDTLVIFTSDNGPWLSKKEDSGTALPLRDGKFSAYEGGMRVPCVMRWPGVIPPNSTCSQPASTIDFLPTLAGVAGASSPADVLIDGRDILPLISGKSDSAPHDAIYYYRGERLAAVREGDWKLHLAWTRQPNSDEPEPMPPELYDLRTDVAESRNVAMGRPDVVERLAGIAATFGTSLKADARPAGRLVPSPEG
jgi:arylsulfatase A